jgi:hypothetical protein
VTRRQRIVLDNKMQFKEISIYSELLLLKPFKYFSRNEKKLLDALIKYLENKTGARQKRELAQDLKLLQ